MPVAERMLEAFLMSQVTTKRFSAVSSLLPGVAVIFGLTILVAFMLFMLALSLLYVIYASFVAYGFSSLGAFGLTNLLVLVVVLALIGIIQCTLHRLKEDVVGLTQAPLVSKVSRVGRAFLCGLAPTAARGTWRRRY